MTVTSRALEKSREYTPENIENIENICNFRWLQKIGRDDADVTWRGRASRYQHERRWSPTVDSLVRRTGSDDVDADLIPRSACWKSSSTRYVRAVHCSIWKPEWRAGTESVLELSTNVADEGVERCGRWRHQPDSGVHHWLELLELVRRDVVSTTSLWHDQLVPTQWRCRNPDMTL